MIVDLTGKLALVVGSEGPLREALVASLEQNGARVLRADLDAAGRLLPADATLPAIDLADDPAAQKGRLVASTGEPYLLLALHPGATPPPDGAQAGPGWDARVLVRLVRAFAPPVRRIVALLSVAGLVPLRAAPLFSAAQAELVAAVRSLAMEHGAAGVHLNAVALGAIETPAEPIGANLLSHTELKRPARLDEITAAVLFLADPANSYMTGHVAVVDGGFVAGYARDF